MPLASPFPTNLRTRRSRAGTEKWVIFSRLSALPGERLAGATARSSNRWRIRGSARRALVISCVDSRVDPAMIFDTAPGEMLTVRNVANLVPPYAPDVAYHGTSAALEFGVRVLEVPHVVVLGHELCGGVQRSARGRSGHCSGLRRPLDVDGRVGAGSGRWPAFASRKTGSSAPNRTSIKVSLDNLMTFPWIAAPVAAGNLNLHGAWFSIRTGVLMGCAPTGHSASRCERITVALLVLPVNTAPATDSALETRVDASRDRWAFVWLALSSLAICSRGQLPSHRADILLQLLLVPRADHDADDARPLQHPVQRDLRDRLPRLARNLIERVDHRTYNLSERVPARKSAVERLSPGAALPRRIFPVSAPPPRALQTTVPTF